MCWGDPIPIAGIAGDQHAALFGQACFSRGQVKTTYGTGCFVLLNAGNRPPISENQLLSTLAWQIGDQSTYALEGSVFMGGAVIQWLRDNLGLIATAAESEVVAASVPDSAGAVLVPAFTGLGAPDWDPRARAALLGMTRDTRAAHIVRAGLEAIALQVCDVLAAMEADTAAPIAEMRVDGGAAVNDLLMQLQADFSGIPVIRPAVTETTGLGAALVCPSIADTSCCTTRRNNATARRPASSAAPVCQLQKRMLPTQVPSESSSSTGSPRRTAPPTRASSSAPQGYPRPVVEVAVDARPGSQLEPVGNDVRIAANRAADDDFPRRRAEVFPPPTPRDPRCCWRSSSRPE